METRTQKTALARAPCLWLVWTVITACSSAPVPASQRSAHWARPLNRPGLDNLFQVTPSLFRGAQPESEGFAELARMGIRTVVNLRAFGSDLDEIRRAGLTDDTFRYIQIPMVAWNVEDRHVARFLRIATDPRRQPVFVHCTHGADRTGTMIAAYRMVIQGWTADQAVCEMTRGGFGYHPIWSGLPEYLSALEVREMRRHLKSPGTQQVRVK